MGLSPEERKRIYEEEKARIEAEERRERERQGAEGITSTGLKPTTAAALCYVGIWVSGLVFFLIEEKNRFVRFHAAQSIIVFGTLMVAAIILGWIPFVGGAFSAIIGVIAFVLWILMMVKAANGERYKLPWAGDIAGRMTDTQVRGDQSAEKRAYAETRPPEPPPAAAPLAPTAEARVARSGDFFADTRSGRIASSGAAIAWGIVLLVFFNFFSQYIAYYHNGVREPILTGDFKLVLPILNTALILSVIGHIFLIVFDRYLLRQITIIVLNLLGIAVVVTFLSIFPFDFGVIPNRSIADIASIVTTIVLIVTAIGLGVGTLVTFIKLLINISRGRIQY